MIFIIKKRITLVRNALLICNVGYVAVLSIPNDPDLQTPDFHIQTDKQTMDHLQTFKIVGLNAQAKEYQAHVNICYQAIVLNVLYYSQY